MPSLNDNDIGPGAALSAAGIPAQPESATGEWWEDELDRGDPLAPALLTSRHAARAAAREQGQPLTTETAALFAANRRQAAVVRCIFGNPLRRGTLDPTWLSATTRSLAQAAYEERQLPSGEVDSARLAVLADALEEAGCMEQAILDHLRGPGPHFRGCFALDLNLSTDP